MLAVAYWVFKLKVAKCGLLSMFLEVEKHIVWFAEVCFCSC